MFHGGRNQYTRWEVYLVSDQCTVGMISELQFGVHSARISLCWGGYEMDSFRWSFYHEYATSWWMKSCTIHVLWIPSKVVHPFCPSTVWTAWDDAWTCSKWFANGLLDLSNLYYKLRYYKWIVPHLASHLTNHFAFHPETMQVEGTPKMTFWPSTFPQVQSLRPVARRWVEVMLQILSWKA